MASAADSACLLSLRMIPVADHCANGNCFRRFQFCNVKKSGRSKLDQTKYALECALHLNYEKQEMEILELQGNQESVIKASGGFHDASDVTTVQCVGTNTDMAKIRLLHTGSFKISYLADNLENMYVTAVPNGFMIQSTNNQLTIGNIMSNKKQFENSMTLETFLILSNQQCSIILSLMAKMASSVAVFRESMLLSPVPAAILSWVTAHEASIPRTTIGTLEYTLRQMIYARFVLSEFTHPTTMTINLLNFSNRIIFSMEIKQVYEGGKYKGTVLHVNDNYGVPVLSADGLNLKQKLVVWNSLTDEYVGGAKVLKEHRSNFPKGSSVPLVDENDKTVMVAGCLPMTNMKSKYTDAVTFCSMFHVFLGSSFDTKIATLLADGDTRILHFNSSSLPTKWKVIILAFATKVLMNYYLRKYQFKICTPHLGYIAP